MIDTNIVDQITEQFCTYIEKNHKGANKAVSNKELETVFGIKGRMIRKIVNSLRCNEIPICSDAVGYYWGETLQEKRATIAQLNSRIRKISSARDGLINYLQKL